MTTSTAFEAVIAAWDEQVRCEMPTQAGNHCQRLAYWRVDLHGCELVLMCGQHKQKWLRRALAECRSRVPECAFCHRTFDSLEAACKVTPL
jgi:hypothetical protein